MCAAELTLEGVCIEALWLPALFTFNQCRANRLDLRIPFLFSPNEITDVFAIVGVVATFELRLDPLRRRLLAMDAVRLLALTYASSTMEILYPINH